MILCHGRVDRPAFQKKVFNGDGVGEGTVIYMPEAEKKRKRENPSINDVGLDFSM